MKYLPYVVFVVILVGLALFASRARRRQAEAETARTQRIGLGSEVMTTSGLYGTVVGRLPDDTVQLAIAPGVEVRWALAALRDVSTLPARYRTDTSHADGDPAG